MGDKSTQTETRRIDLSICIVNWNSRDVLRDCLASLAARRDEATIEVIVVDNASTDAAPDMVARDFSWARLIRNDTNRGFSAANNQAAAAARGRNLLFLNNDTLVPPGSLARLVDFIDHTPDAAGVGPQLLNPDGTHQPAYRGPFSLAALLHELRLFHWCRIFRRAHRAYRKPALNPDQTAVIDQVAGAALAVPRTLFEAVGRWDESFTFGVEDLDLCRRLRERGRIYYLADAPITHLGGVSSRANTRYAYRNFACGHARYLGKHHPRQAAIFKTLWTLDQPLVIVSSLLAAAFAALRGNRRRASDKRRLAKSAAAFLLVDVVQFWRS